MSNLHLNKTQYKKIKDDEFYTLYSDIEKEIPHYDLSEKIVYCPCDEWDKSNFCKYFYNNFHKLKLKKLYCSWLNGKLISYDGENIEETNLESGDFRSTECLEILKQSDIVITNPPFSIIREFSELYLNKDFIIIIPTTSLTYKVFQKYILDWHITKEIGFFERPDGTKKHQSCFFLSNIDTHRDRKLVLVDKPITDYEFVTYKGKDYLWTQNIHNIPDNYYEPLFVPIRYIIIKDKNFEFLEFAISPFSKKRNKKLFKQCFIKRRN